jgi:hypothetical protein
MRLMYILPMIMVVERLAPLRKKNNLMQWYKETQENYICGFADYNDYIFRFYGYEYARAYGLWNCSTFSNKVDIVYWTVGVITISYNNSFFCTVYGFTKTNIALPPEITDTQVTSGAGTTTVLVTPAKAKAMIEAHAPAGVETFETILNNHRFQQGRYCLLNRWCYNYKLQ